MNTGRIKSDHDVERDAAVRSGAPPYGSSDTASSAEAALAPPTSL